MEKEYKGKGNNKGVKRRKQVEEDIKRVTVKIGRLEKELQKGKMKLKQGKLFHTKFCHICFETMANPTLLKTHLMSHRTDRAIICKVCGAKLNPAKWSNIVGKLGHFKKAHILSEEEILLSMVWKLTPEKEDEEIEDLEEKEDLYQFENDKEETEEETDEEESESSSDEDETDDELLMYETKIGKSLTDNLKVILMEPEDEEITEKDFLALKKKLFNS